MPPTLRGFSQCFGAHPYLQHCSWHLPSSLLPYSPNTRLPAPPLCTLHAPPEPHLCPRCPLCRWCWPRAACTYAAPGHCLLSFAMHCSAAFGSEPYRNLASCSSSSYPSSEPHLCPRRPLCRWCWTRAVSKYAAPRCWCEGPRVSGVAAADAQEREDGHVR